MSQQKLFRSEKNRVFAGICGGLGEYFNVDPVPLRLAWLLIVIFSGIFPGVIAYILAIFIIPPEPTSREAHESDAKHEGHQHNPADE
jgi:phage shock protein C